MNDIKDLIQKAQKNLNKKNKIITPSAYEKEVFELLSNTDILLEDYVEFEELVEQLSKDEKIYFDKNNISSFKELAMLLVKRIDASEIKEFLNHLSYYMSPSLNNIEIKEEIEQTCSLIAKNPTQLTENEKKRELRKIAQRRIEEDKSLFTDKTSDVKKLISFLTNFLKKNLNDNKTSIDELNEIKEELKKLDLSNSSLKDFEELQSKLLDITDKFETTLNKNSNTIEDTNDKCDVLYEQIEELQGSLSKAEEEKSIDFLTEVLNRRAFDMEVKRIENEYQTYDSNYAFVFFDIDHFKKVNDKYGHICGDSILKTFAAILKKLTRTEDIVVRYGGEEFVTIVHYKNKLEISNYIKRVKNIISNNKFVCDDLKINIQFCAGVSFRDNYNSYEEALIKSDELLYTAKHTGRNKILFDNGEVF